MDESVLELKKHLKMLLNFLKEKKQNHVNHKPKKYSQKIEAFRDRFRQYYETTTPKPALSKLYSCTGRLKFYGDKMLYIYLEVEDKLSKNCIQLSTALLWPVMCTWKVEMIDENDEDNKEKTFTLGEASCIFNKPRKGFKSHPNDWISIDLARIENSGLISKDGSVTLRWTVLTEPFLHGVYVEEFQKLLEKLEKFCDSYEGPETILSRIKQAVDEILEKRKENGEKISALENKVSNIEGKLNTIEKEQGEFRRTFKDFEKRVMPLLQVRRCGQGHSTV